jgi:hypothetical protein
VPISACKRDIQFICELSSSVTDGDEREKVLKKTGPT